MFADAIRQTREQETRTQWLRYHLSCIIIETTEIVAQFATTETLQSSRGNNYKLDLSQANREFDFDKESNRFGTA
jgi:hypothetical protein